MKKSLRNIASEIEFFHRARQSLKVMEATLNHLKSEKEFTFQSKLTGTSNLELEKAKKIIIDDYSANIAKLKFELDKSGRSILLWFQKNGRTEDFIEDFEIPHPANRNQSIIIKVGLKQSVLIVED